MFRLSIYRAGAAAAVSALMISGSALAASFADKVVSYDAGTGAGGYATPSAAVGSPDGITGEGFGYPSVLSPFSPAFDTDEIVVVGEGGQLTLHLSAPAKVGSGHEVGVISNIGLVDVDYPNGQNDGPAWTFSPKFAEVQVSADDSTYVSLGTIVFQNPANYFLNAGPFDSTAPASPDLADFGKPFLGDITSFDGKNFADTLEVLDGSGGGTWLDLSKTGLTTVSFIKFIVPDDGDPTTKMAVDAVVVANDSLYVIPTAVPLPAAALPGLLGLGALGLVRRRKTA